LQLEEGLPDFNNFGTNIPDMTGHMMTTQVSTSRNVCICTACKKWNKQNIHGNEQKRLSVVA